MHAHVSVYRQVGQVVCSHKVRIDLLDSVEVSELDHGMADWWPSHTKRKPQYNMLMSTSRGAEVTERTFLIMNSRGDENTSAAAAVTYVTVARHNPIIVLFNTSQC